MDTIYAKFDGSVFVPTKPVKVRLNQIVAITLIEDSPPMVSRPDIMSFAGALSDADAVAFETAVRESRKIDESGW